VEDQQLSTLILRLKAHIAERGRNWASG